MQFKVGDIVVHPSYGVGKVVQIEEKRLSVEADPALYYRGTFRAFPKTDVWTPVRTIEGAGLRLVTAKSDLEHYRETLRSRPDTADDTSSQRHRGPAKRLRYASFQTMCEVARDLTMISWQKPLGAVDATILKQTLEFLSQEWSVAAGISFDEANTEVMSLLRNPSEGLES